MLHLSIATANQKICYGKSKNLLRQIKKFVTTNKKKSVMTNKKICYDK